jgi:hypothetical protein
MFSGADNEKYIVKVAGSMLKDVLVMSIDFGLSRSAEFGIYKQSRRETPIPYRWTAPEVLKYGVYSSKVNTNISHAF